MRVVKSISLPVDLAKKAEQFDNLSLFVQDCINHGIEHNNQVYQRNNIYLNKENEQLDNLIHGITDIILDPGKMYPSDKLKKINKLLVAADWIIIEEVKK